MRPHVAKLGALSRLPDEVGDARGGAPRSDTNNQGRLSRAVACERSESPQTSASTRSGERSPWYPAALMLQA